MNSDRDVFGQSDQMRMNRLSDAVRIAMPPKDHNLADEFYKRLVTWINDFDEELDNEHEVGVRLVSLGESVTFHIQDLGYWNPSLISYSGVTTEGNQVKLIQHVSQISVLLMKLPRIDPSKPKRKIGFKPDDKIAESAQRSLED